MGVFGGNLVRSPLLGPPGVLLPNILTSSARPARRGACTAATSAAPGALPPTEKQNLHAPVSDAQNTSNQA